MTALRTQLQEVGTYPMERSPISRLVLRGLAGGLAAGTLIALATATVADAQGISGINSEQPVNYAADRIELQDKQQRVVLTGDVVIDQGDLRLTAGRTTVAYTDDDGIRIQRIDATGGVTVTRGSEQASGSAGVYDFNRRVIVLSGGVTLRRNGDTLNGGRLTIDLSSGLASVDGKSGKSSTGRVSGTFSVPKNIDRKIDD